MYHSLFIVLTAPSGNHTVDR